MLQSGSHMEWNSVFYISTIIALIPVVVFNIWGSADVQASIQHPSLTKQADIRHQNNTSAPWHSHLNYKGWKWKHFMLKPIFTPTYYQKLQLKKKIIFPTSQIHRCGNGEAPEFPQGKTEGGESVGRKSQGFGPKLLSKWLQTCPRRWVPSQ